MPSSRPRVLARTITRRGVGWRSGRSPSSTAATGPAERNCGAAGPGCHNESTRASRQAQEPPADAETWLDKGICNAMRAHGGKNPEKTRPYRRGSGRRSRPASADRARHRAPDVVEEPQEWSCACPRPAPRSGTVVATLRDAEVSSRTLTQTLQINQVDRASSRTQRVGQVDAAVAARRRTRGDAGPPRWVERRVGRWTRLRFSTARSSWTACHGNARAAWWRCAPCWRSSG